MSWFSSVTKPIRKGISRITGGGLGKIGGKLKKGLFGESGSEESNNVGTYNQDQNSTTTQTPYLNTSSQISGLAGNESALAKLLTSSYTQNLPLTDQARQTSLSDIIGDITANNQVEGQQRALAGKFYDMAGTPIDANAKANQAEADIINAFQKGQDAWSRNLGRYGIDANNMSNNSRINEIERAKAIAGARTAAMDKADEDTFNRLKTGMATYGMSTGQNSYSGGTSVNDILNAINSGGSLYARLLTPKSTTFKGASSGTSTGNSSTDTSHTPGLWESLMGSGKGGMEGINGIMAMNGGMSLPSLPPM